MKSNSEIIKSALRILAAIGVLLLLLAAWLVWKNPDGVGGYLTGAFAALQLVISKIGEAIRAGSTVEPEPLDLTGAEVMP